MYTTHTHNTTHTHTHTHTNTNTHTNTHILPVQTQQGLECRIAGQLIEALYCGCLDRLLAVFGTTHSIDSGVNNSH